MANPQILFDVLIQGESKKIRAESAVEAAEFGVDSYEFRHSNFSVAAEGDEFFVQVTTPSGDTHNFNVTGRLVRLYTAEPATR